jgi:hypothetical protein
MNNIDKIRAAIARIKELEEQANGLHELFKVNQRDIKEEVERALGFEQYIDALGAVRRLAERYVEAKSTPVIVKILRGQDGRAFAVYLSDGQKIGIQRDGAAAWLRIEPTPIVREAGGDEGE